MLTNPASKVPRRNSTANRDGGNRHNLPSSPRTSGAAFKYGTDPARIGESPPTAAVRTSFVEMFTNRTFRFQHPDTRSRR
jgi:hypothetical protein